MRPGALERVRLAREATLRVLIAVVVEIDDPAALTAHAREAYSGAVPAVNVDGMTDEEALAVANLSPEELRAHPRRVTPEQAVRDGATAVLQLVELALRTPGVHLESSYTERLRHGPRAHSERVPGGRHREPRGAQRRAPRSPTGRRSR